MGRHPEVSQDPVHSVVAFVSDVVVDETEIAVNCRHPLAFILEAADDIAYKTADMEDAVKKGFLTCPKLIFELKNTYMCKCGNEKQKAVMERAVSKLEYYYGQALEKQLSSPEQNAVQRWIIYVQGVLLRAASASFIDNYSAIMDGDFPRELLAASDSETLVYALGDMAYRFVFCSKEIYSLEIGAGEIYEVLLSKLTRAAVAFDTDYAGSAIEQRVMRLVSENYIRAYRFGSEGKNETEKLYLRLMLVTDYICGMTDSYAKKLYTELSGIG